MLENFCPTITGNPVELSKEQKELALSLFNENKKLQEITRIIFNNPKLDGRTNEGKGVRLYLQSVGIRPSDIKTEKTLPVIQELTPEQQKYIKENYEDTQLKELTQTVFPEAKILPTCKEILAVKRYIAMIDPTAASKMRGMMKGEAYIPPNNYVDLCKKIEKVSGRVIDPNKPTSNERNCLDFLMRAMSTARFIARMEELESNSERSIFEREYVSAVWDKPDLTPDELNLYINLCDQYIAHSRIDRRCKVLDDLFMKIAEGNNGREMTMSLSDTVKTQEAARDATLKSISDLIKRLNGDRASRLAKRGEKTVSILSVVQAFQQEEERKRMIKVAEMQREAIKEKMGEFENMAAWKARIMGLDKEMFS